MNIILSNIILKVEIKTSNKELEKVIRKDLYQLGLKPFQINKSYQEQKRIKQELLNIENDKIEWLEIEKKGTKYIVTIEEKKKKEEEICNPRNLIARKNAMITKIESSSGEIIKKKLEYVSKGEIIISGIIHNKEENVGVKCAEGKVYGETWYKVTLEMPREERIIKTKNHFQTILQIKIGEKELSFPKKKNWLIINEYHIIDSRIFPLNISIIKQQESNQKTTKYTLENIDNIAYKKAKKLLEEKILSKPNVIRKKVLKKSIKNSKIIVEVFFALEEDITSYQEITEDMLIKKEG